MKVIDILRVKGGTLFTVSPDEYLSVVVTTMADQDIGSLVVMAHGELVGMLTFREVIEALVRNGGSIGSLQVRGVMDDHPLTCTPETDMDEVRRMMLGRRRSSSGWMSASDRVNPGGQPSITQPIAGPWLSPKLVTLNNSPKVLPDMGNP